MTDRLDDDVTLVRRSLPAPLSDGSSPALEAATERLAAAMSDRRYAPGEPIEPTRITVPGYRASGWVVLDGPNEHGILGVVYADRDKAERTAKRHGAPCVSVSWPPLPGAAQ